MEASVSQGVQAESTGRVSQEGTLTPEQVLAEREKVLAEREAEMDKREKALKAPPTDTARTEAQRLDQAKVKARMDDGWYCPGCGRSSKYPRECNGTATAPHPAIEMVESKELDGDPEKFTAAPDSVL